MQTLTITTPDDMHMHFRDDEQLATTVPHCAEYCDRAIVMPNLKPPVNNLASAKAYHQRIMQALPANRKAFVPLMTLYLTESTTPAEIIEAHQSGIVFAAKYYPANATTHSAAGIRDWRNIQNVLATLAEVDMPLLIHGEITDPTTDIFDREALFVKHELHPLHKTFPSLRIVLEHISTTEAIAFVTNADEHIAATITVHHLLLNRNDLFTQGIRPHHYCLPILKRATHQQALCVAATSGNPKFFMGTDSAPHSVETKETACGCAGIYTAPVALPLYASLFEAHDALTKLEAFCSHYGADFYRLSRNSTQLTLVKQPWQVPEYYSYGQSHIKPLCANQTLAWQILTQSDKK